MRVLWRYWDSGLKVCTTLHSIRNPSKKNVQNQGANHSASRPPQVRNLYLYLPSTSRPQELRRVYRRKIRVKCLTKTRMAITSTEVAAAPVWLLIDITLLGLGVLHGAIPPSKLPQRKRGRTQREGGRPQAMRQFPRSLRSLLAAVAPQ